MIALHTGVRLTAGVAESGEGEWIFEILRRYGFLTAIQTAEIQIHGWGPFAVVLHLSILALGLDNRA